MMQVHTISQTNWVDATDLYLKMALLRLKRSTLIFLGHICQNLFHTGLKFDCRQLWRCERSTIMKGTAQGSGMELPLFMFHNARV